MPYSGGADLESKHDADLESVTAAMAGSRLTGMSSTGAPAMKLELHKCPSKTEASRPHSSSSRKSSADRRALVCKEKVLVRFAFLDGSVAEHVFLMGQTVEVLKAFLATEFELDMPSIELRFERQAMADPLSLNDFVDDAAGGMQVSVVLDDDAWLGEGKSSKK